MADYPQTGSWLYQNGTTAGSTGVNRTGTALSTMIILMVNENPVGAVQTLRVQERRNVKMIPEIGTDGFIDSAPNTATEISGSCTRVRFDRMRIPEAFSRGFLHVSSQRIPFDIQIIDRFNGTTMDEAIITIVKNVWITDIVTNYSAADYVISDEMNWKAEAIMSYLQGGQANAATGGVRGMSKLQLDPYEREADIGNRRGALDAPGLATAVFSI